MCEDENLYYEVEEEELDEERGELRKKKVIRMLEKKRHLTWR